MPLKKMDLSADRPDRIRNLCIYPEKYPDGASYFPINGGLDLISPDIFLELRDIDLHRIKEGKPLTPDQCVHLRSCLLEIGDAYASDLAELVKPGQTIDLDEHRRILGPLFNGEVQPDTAGTPSR